LPTNRFRVIRSPLEVLWGQEFFGALWESAQTEAELARLRYFHDQNAGWKSFGPYADDPEPVLPKEHLVFEGPESERSQAEVDRARAINMLRQVEEVQRQIALINRYGEDFNPLQNFASTDEFAEVQKARAICARVKEAHSRGSLAESETRSVTGSNVVPLKHPSREDVAKSDQKKSWRPNAAAKLSRAQIVVLEALNVIYPDGDLVHTGKVRDNRINEWLNKAKGLKVGSRVIQRCLKQISFR